MKYSFYTYVGLACLLWGWIGGTPLKGQPHPQLLFTPETVTQIQAEYRQVPLYLAEVEAAEARVMKAIAKGLDLPVPKDMAGGYTHEQHKQNWINMHDAAVLYQITQETKYARYVRDMLLAYADLYPTLGIHPTQRSYATGKLFWQCLNDANWLVFTSESYDCVYDFLTEEEHEKLEQDLFRPMAKFLSEENPQFFDRIHNHSTWACAAVGMIALVIQDEALLERALYGLPDSLAPAKSEDNDGGIIGGASGGQKGFFAQLDKAFSPDGFFTEGPYYLRYALTPYLLFANALENATEDIKVFAYRDTLLEKAVYSLLSQVDDRGWVFPVNDAQKGMNWHAPSIISAVDIAYAQFGEDPRLLSIAQKQGKISLDQAGFQVAKALAEGKAQPWERESAFFTDGPQGKMGGFSVLRAGKGEHALTLAFKYSAHGGGHGHYDRLSYSLYNHQGEVLQDYGAARWVNIEQKGGGRYLPENKSWGKHTLAHNTVVVDQQSQNQGKVRVAESHAAKQHFALQSESGWQAVRVKDSLSYPGCMLDRTLILQEKSDNTFPLLWDVYRIVSDEVHTYDLPHWYQGHFMEVKGASSPEASPATVLGKKYGYEHVWQEAKAAATEATSQVSWFDGTHFTTLTTLTDTPADSLLWVRTGANDPQFNLRHDPGILIRKKGTYTLFFSLVEHHGAYDPAVEIPTQPYSRLKEVKQHRNDASYTVLELEDLQGHATLLLMANQASMYPNTHRLTVEGQVYEWTGPLTLISVN